MLGVAAVRKIFRVLNFVASSNINRHRKAATKCPQQCHPKVENHLLPCRFSIAALLHLLTCYVPLVFRSTHRGRASFLSWQRRYLTSSTSDPHSTLPTEDISNPPASTAYGSARRELNNRTGKSLEMGIFTAPKCSRSDSEGTFKTQRNNTHNGLL